MGWEEKARSVAKKARLRRRTGLSVQAEETQEERRARHTRGSRRTSRPRREERAKANAVGRGRSEAISITSSNGREESGNAMSYVASLVVRVGVEVEV